MVGDYGCRRRQRGKLDIKSRPPAVPAPAAALDHYPLAIGHLLSDASPNHDWSLLKTAAQRRNCEGGFKYCEFVTSLVAWTLKASAVRL